LRPTVAPAVGAAVLPSLVGGAVTLARPVACIMTFAGVVLALDLEAGLVTGALRALSSSASASLNRLLLGGRVVGSPPAPAAAVAPPAPAAAATCVIFFEQATPSKQRFVRTRRLNHG